MTKIRYLKEVPLAKKVFGFVLGIAGIGILLFSNLIFGAIATVLAINLLLTEGAEIDLSNKTYRNLKSIFRIDFGTWKPCPAFEYVSVFRTKEHQTVNVVTASTTFSSNVFLLNLFFDRNKHMTFYKTDNKADAFKVADHFRLALDVDILDATEAEKTWL